MLLSNRMIDLQAKNVQLEEWTARVDPGNVFGHLIKQWVNDAYILDNVLSYRIPGRVRDDIAGERLANPSTAHHSCCLRIMDLSKTHRQTQRVKARLSATTASADLRATSWVAAIDWI